LGNLPAALGSAMSSARSFSVRVMAAECQSQELLATFFLTRDFGGRKSIEVKSNSFLTKHIGIRGLTIIIIVCSLINGVATLLQNRITGNLEILIMEVAWIFGPLLCGFLFCLLLAQIFSARGGHPIALTLGTVFGFGTFCVWLYVASHH
jgi:hypothetical protein